MKRTRPGFTLTELLIVMAIIGIIIAFILTAATDGIRRAEERATQALIIKLEGALTDRIDALTYQRIRPTVAHHLMGAITLSSGQVLYSMGRSQVIAQFDFLKAELPDVFVVNPAGASATAGSYPINFAAQPFTRTDSLDPYALPMGCDIGTSLLNSPPNAQTGTQGASFSVAAGIYKNLGYAQQGYDGIDNNNDGWVDDYLEGTGSLNAGDAANVASRLANHKHATARSEMLYAILVEGQGPLGSAFNRDDFTNKEVQDTDNDGLPEFVDAWGQPLQFFRWPIFYHSDLQKGFTAGATGHGPYDSVFQSREQNPIDPNQLLVAPAWWSSASNTSGTASGGVSGSALTFESYFTSLKEPLVSCGAVTGASANTNAYFWDRGGNYFARRAFFSKFLILSGGPDQNPGVALCDVDYKNLHTDFIHDGSGAVVSSQVASDGSNLSSVVTALLHEDQALQTDLNFPANSLSNNTATFLIDAAGDDITNHNINAPGGAIK